MKSIRTIAAYLLVLALAGVSSLKSAEPGRVQTKAIVRSVTGDVSFTKPDGTTGKLKVNMQLEPGVTITTGPDSTVYLSVNGLSSAVRIQPDTTMAISEMSRIGSARQGDTDTMLDLRTGAIMGSVQKVGGNSHYEVKTPHGVAGIRGTDFQITVSLLPNGTYQVTFTSVTGQVIVSAIVNGASEVRTLRTGQSWTPGDGDVRPTPQYLLNQYQTLIAAMITFINQTGVPTITVTVHNPYQSNGGTPPGQPPSSPSTP
jgi:hypothetical protein